MTTNQTVNKDWKPIPQNPNQPLEDGISLWDALLAQPDYLDEDEEEETPAPTEKKTGASGQ